MMSDQSHAVKIICAWVFAIWRNDLLVSSFRSGRFLKMLLWRIFEQNTAYFLGKVVVVVFAGGMFHFY
jgi:hypothetical protein